VRDRAARPHVDVKLPNPRDVEGLRSRDVGERRLEGPTGFQRRHARDLLPRSVCGPDRSALALRESVSRPAGRIPGYVTLGCYVTGGGADFRARMSARYEPFGGASASVPPMDTGRNELVRRARAVAIGVLFVAACGGATDDGPLSGDRDSGGVDGTKMVCTP